MYKKLTREGERGKEKRPSERASERTRNRKADETEKKDWC